MNKFDSSPYSAEVLSCARADILSPFRFEPPIHLGSVSLMGDISIGRHTYFNEGYARDGVDIGRFCSIGRRVTIAAGRHTIDWITTHPIGSSAKKDLDIDDKSSRLYRERPRTTIGHDVWIGDGVVVMPGVTVGTGAVLAAGAIVTKSVPPYAVVGGSAAKVISQRFDEKTISDLLASEWWTLPDNAIRLLTVNNPAECIKQIPELRGRFGTVPFKYLGDLEHATKPGLAL